MFYRHLYGPAERYWPPASSRPPYDGFRFGFNLTLIDDDTPKGTKATKAVTWTQSLLVSDKKYKLMDGFVPSRMGTVIQRDDLPRRSAKKKTGIDMRTLLPPK